MRFVVYSPAGEILRSGRCDPASFSDQALAGEKVMEGIVDDLTQWVEEIDVPGLGAMPVITDKVPLPATIDKTVLTADGLDEATIAGLPNPSTVTVIETGQRVVITDGDLQFAADVQGTYTLRCECFPYLPAQFEVTAQ